MTIEEQLRQERESRIQYGQYLDAVFTALCPSSDPSERRTYVPTQLPQMIDLLKVKNEQLEARVYELEAQVATLEHDLDIPGAPNAD